MKLINPTVEIIPQEKGLTGIYKQIELAGRTCYKSEDKITENSCVEFTQRMINSGHTAMLEHGTVYMAVPMEDWETDSHEWEYMFPEGCPWISMDCDSRFHLITTNFRHIIEREVGVETMEKYLCNPINGHEKRVTARFICDRGVMAEVTRHRAFSFAVESTRYCNYSKNKFGNQLTFIIPTWYNDSEDAYLDLIDHQYTPQQARQVLPNALKTEVVMTGFVSDWKHFFDLRCAKNAHPDMQVLANKLKQQFVDNNLL